MGWGWTAGLGVFGVYKWPDVIGPPEISESSGILGLPAGSAPGHPERHLNFPNITFTRFQLISTRNIVSRTRFGGLLDTLHRFGLNTFN